MVKHGAECMCVNERDDKIESPSPSETITYLYDQSIKDFSNTLSSIKHFFRSDVIIKRDIQTKINQ